MDKQKMQSLISKIEDDKRRFLEDLQHKADVQIAWFDGRIKQLELLITETDELEQP